MLKLARSGPVLAVVGQSGLPLELGNTVLHSIAIVGVKDCLLEKGKVRVGWRISGSHSSGLVNGRHSCGRLDSQQSRENESEDSGRKHDDLTSFLDGWSIRVEECCGI